MTQKELLQLIDDVRGTNYKDFSERIIEYKMFFESPLKIPHWDKNDFEDSSKNIAMTIAAEESAKYIGEFSNCKLYRSTDNVFIYDYFINSGFIRAHFKYELKHNVMHERLVWQYYLCSGLCRDLIFSYYLNTYKGIISDNSHSPLGEEYWRKLIEEALKLNTYKIFVVNQKTKKFIPFDDIQYFKKYFSHSIQHFDYQFVIYVA